MKKIALTGIKPTGTPHIGNYLGMIKPALELVDDYQALYFIADYHALITVKDRKELSAAGLRGGGHLVGFGPESPQDHFLSPVRHPGNFRTGVDPLMLYRQRSS